jgi:predicted nucleic-acid-binding protein
MIGVDTNVLVRFFVRDDMRQGASAERFMNERTTDDPAFVSVVAIVELAWALEQIYQYQRQQIVSAVALLLGSGNVVVEDEELVKAAIAEVSAVNITVVDCLIARIALEAGATSTVTFDRDAARRVPGMELLK